MIFVHSNEVELAIEKTPITEVLVQYDINVAERAEIMSDLHVLFTALVSHYGEGELAEMIEITMKDAIKDKGHCRNVNK